MSDSHGLKEGNRTSPASNAKTLWLTPTQNIFITQSQHSNSAKHSLNNGNVLNVVYVLNP